MLYMYCKLFLSGESHIAVMVRLSLSEEVRFITLEGSVKKGSHINKVLMWQFHFYIKKILYVLLK